MNTQTKPKWEPCGQNGCVGGWIEVTSTQTVKRFIGQWVAEKEGEVGGEGKFVHPETKERMKYHRPLVGDDPDFVTATVEVAEVIKCPCHPNHWTISS